jgi:hypothetical protein
MRISDEMKTNLPKEMLLTMGMLFGGTPIILYGDELGIEEVCLVEIIFSFKYIIELENESFNVMDT